MCGIPRKYIKVEASNSPTWNWGDWGGTEINRSTEKFNIHRAIPSNAGSITEGLIYCKKCGEWISKGPNSRNKGTKWGSKKRVEIEWKGLHLRREQGKPCVPKKEGSVESDSSPGELTNSLGNFDSSPELARWVWSGTSGEFDSSLELARWVWQLTWTRPASLIGDLGWVDFLLWKVIGA